MDQHKAIMRAIYELNALDVISAKEMGIGQAFSVLRVPGGWLYLFPTYGCFVPFNDEFLEKAKKKTPARKKAGDGSAKKK